MHLIFIRHGDPDYTIDSVTEKGKKELELLADRLAGFNATEFYVSPMGRASLGLHLFSRSVFAPSFIFAIKDVQNSSYPG